MARQFAAGATQYLEAGAVPFAAFGPGSVFSVGGWFYPLVVTGNHFPFMISEPTNVEGMGLWMAGGVMQALSRHGSANSLAASSLTLVPNTWYHVGATYNGFTQQAVYVNGGSKGTSILGGAASLSTLRFGLWSAIGMDARIGEWGMWNALLTDDEMASLARGISPDQIRPQSLTGHWHIFGAQSPEPDTFGKYSLTVLNAPPVVDHPRIYQRTRPRRAFAVLLPPTVPVYVSPALGALEQVAPALVWNPAVSAAAYDVYFGTTTPPPLVAADVAALTYSPAIAVYDGTIRYWQIVAKNSSGSTPGPIWNFFVHAPPAIPNSPSPADGAIGVDGAAALSWVSARGDTYDLYFGTVDPPPLLTPGIPFPAYPLPDVDAAVRYYWRIRAHNEVGSTLGPVWQFRAAVGAVYVAATRLEAQVGDGFRATLIRTPFNAGTWPLSELARLRATDISGQGRPGVYTGAGFESGIPFNIPEGCLGTRFTGDQLIEIADPGGGGVYNLSLAGGQFDLAIMIKEHVIDTVRRALIAKHDGARLTGNGYYLATINGAVELSLTDQGVNLFRFQRGALTSGEHLITAYYREGEAFIAIDGVKQEPSVFISPTAELTALTLAPVRVGHFSDGAAGDGLGQKAVLAYATLSRQGDSFYGFRLQEQRVWIDLSPNTRTLASIETRTGITGNGPADNVASSGSLHFTMDNGYRAPVGRFTPGHPGVLPGWGLGSPIRLSFDFGGVTYREFVGRLAAVTPTAGIKNARSAECLATDWIDVAAGTPLSALAAQLNKRSDDVIKAVIDQAQGRSPVSVDIHAGAGVWPFAVDEGESERDTLLTEVSRVCTSERGFAYIRGDTTRGGRFTYEGHPDRVGLPVVASFNNTMQGLEVGYSLEALVNIVRVTYNPRKVDTSIVTLYSLDISQRSELIAGEETRVFEGGYVDPLNLAERVGGTQTVAVSVAGGDIGFNAAADGSGANLAANLRIVQTLGGNSYRLELTNLSGTPGYLRLDASTGFRIRGKGIYHYKPITIERRDTDSIRIRGPRRLEIDLAYESDGAVATLIAEYYLELYGTEQPIPSSLTIAANRTVGMMRAALSLQPGDKIALGEPITGLSVAASRFIVHEKRLTYTAPGVLAASFRLAPAPVSLTLRRPRTSQGPA